MPQMCYGDMWAVWGRPHSIFCVTTNSYLRKDGALVMGRGIARQLRDRKPKAAQDAGIEIMKAKLDGNDPYGFLTLYVCLGDEPPQLLGLFQVKSHFREPADLAIIKTSVVRMNRFLREHPEITEAHLNFPGIGAGRREVYEVEPLLQHLLPHVHVWRHPWEVPDIV